jgi:hypothetical protein
MKSLYETLHEQLQARFPRVVTGDSEVVDEVDSEHTVERLAPLYQLPAWQILRELRDASRKLRVETLPKTFWPCEGSCTHPQPTGYETESNKEK